MHVSFSRLLQFLLLFSAIFGLPSQAAHAFDPCAADAASQYQSIETSYQKGLLFRVEKCGAEPSYLFATMHSDDPNLHPLMQVAAQKLTFSRVAIFELLLDKETKAKIGPLMFAPLEQQKLESKIGTEYFGRLVQELVKTVRMNAENVNQLYPWAAAVLLEAPVSKADGMVLDEKLQKYAEGMHIRTVPLETVEQQFSVFINLPEPKQMLLLKDSLDHLEDSRKVDAQLAEAYSRQDLFKIGIMADETFSKIEDRELRTYMEEHLLNERNNIMVERMLPEITRGNAFIAVGALHFLRGNGILKQLEQKGYFVTAEE